MDNHELLNRIVEDGNPSMTREQREDVVMGWLLSAAEALGLNKTKLHEEILVAQGFEV